MPPLMLNQRGDLVAREDTELVFWLALHGETPSGKAWVFSLDGETATSFYFPKSMCDVGEPHGGFERMHPKTLQRVRIPVHPVSMPKFMAIQKGIIQ